MADTQETPKQTPAQKATSKKAEPMEAERTTPLDLLRAQAPAMGMALLAVIAILLLVVYRSDSNQEFNHGAWRALAELKNSAPAGDEGFEELAKKYAGSQAEPFIRLAWASRLYETGLRNKVERSRDLYDEILRANPNNAFLAELIPAQLEKINVELSSDHAPLLDLVEGPGEDSGDGEDSMGDPHAGHDHGGGEDEAHEDEAPLEDPEAPLEDAGDEAGGE